MSATAGFGATVRNLLEVARFGGLETGEEPTPFEIAAEGAIYRLRHYASDGGRSTRGRAPVMVMVPPLMLTADVYDVSPQSSAVRALHGGGVDPWVVDFGSPEREPGGLERSLADHVLAISDAVDHVRELTGADVHLAGYSQGGMFCYQTAAYRRSDGIASVITFGSPVDLRGAVPLGIPEEVAVHGAGFILENVLRGRAVPGWATRSAFQLLDPVKTVRQRADFLLALGDREALLPRERQRRYLMGDGWIAWPGPALDDFLRQFLIHNRMLTGGFTIGERAVTLADLDSPILTFVGEADEIAPPDCVRAIRRAAPRPTIHEVTIRAGHFGLVVGGSAQRITWPLAATWADAIERRRELPEEIRLVDVTSGGTPAIRAGAASDAKLALGAGSSAARTLAVSAIQSTRALRQAAGLARTQLPQLARISQLKANTRLSLALLFEERATRAPGDVCFLFEDRAHTYGDVNGRIDGVVRGLLARGVRAGEHVGVLMSTRPTALAVIAALNRIGAVAVLLRPGADTGRELRLGAVTRMITDPENAAASSGGLPVDVFLLEPPDRYVDVEFTPLEQPFEGPLPDWYRPNAGRADDIAFIMFTGDEDDPRPIRVTNKRFALSAFGTAASAALTGTDTVFTVNPLHHPSGLLTSVGGALAASARLAMATSLDPDTFWDEARRYGVTVVTYTWTQLRDLVEAPPHPGEQDHPIRLFVGSGMPRGLWRRVIDRFAPAAVVEFWTTSEGDAILANVNGGKPGSLGRMLPGSAEVRIARADLKTGKLETDSRGYAVACDVDEPGILLTRTSPTAGTAGPVLRNLFAKGDAWLSTGAIVARDVDGDHWLRGTVRTMIHTGTGAVAPQPIADALGSVTAVDLVAVYGAPTVAGDELAVAAVTLRAGRALTPEEVQHALAPLEATQQPAVVRVVEQIPTTRWHRPLPDALRQQAIATSTATRPAFVRDAATGQYRRLTASRHRRLGPAHASPPNPAPAGARPTTPSRC